MEILPIVSVLLLVGTVSTLILAVAVYVFNQLRERQIEARGTEHPAAPPQPYVMTAATWGAAPPAPRQRPFELQDLMAPAAARQSETYAYASPARPSAKPNSSFWSAEAENALTGGDGFAWG